MSAHAHVWEEYDAPMGGTMIQLRHGCICGESGVGPEDWCERERQHNHRYEPLPTIAKIAGSYPVSAVFRLLNWLGVGPRI